MQIRAKITHPREPPKRQACNLNLVEYGIANIKLPGKVLQLEPGQLLCEGKAFPGMMAFAAMPAPNPNIVPEFRFDQDVRASDIPFMAQLELVTSTYRLKGRPAALHLSVGNEGSYDQVDVFVEDARPNERVTMIRLLGAVYNFPTMLGGEPTYIRDGITKPTQSRIEAAFGPWSLVIDGSKEADPWKSQLGKDHALTQGIVVQRSNGGCFDGDDALKVREFLFWLFTLCAGSRVACTHLMGVQTGSLKPTWVDPLPLRTDRGTAYSSWLPQYAPDAIPAVAVALEHQWSQGDRREWLATAISTYADSCRRRPGSEAALLVAQTGLELLCWLNLVVLKPLLSEESFDRLPFADRLRLTLDQARVKSDLPPAFAGGKALGPDGPSAVVTVRNVIVHPSAKNRQLLRQLNDQDRYSAWELATYYLELLLLYTIGYEGPYHDRVFDTPRAVPGLVPWAKST